MSFKIDLEVLDSILGQWNDVVWLRDFFKANFEDLASYFKITDVNQAIYDTIEDSEKLQCLIMDISPEANLDEVFRPLDNNRTSEMLLGKEKARLHNTPRHASWLRIYAIKLEPGIYVITGGAIKLTRTMQEREHTLVELARIGVLLRRTTSPNHSQGGETKILTIADLKLDLEKHECTRGGVPIHLTPKEFALLQYLMENALTHYFFALKISRFEINFVHSAVNDCSQRCERLFIAL